MLRLEELKWKYILKEVVENKKSFNGGKKEKVS